MKVMIQDADTRKFFSNQGQWTATPDEAQDFSLANVAYSFAERRGVASFHVLFYYPETHYSIEILSKESPRPTSVNPLARAA
jgi:hypothetical protein